MNYKVYLIENQINGKKYIGYTSKELKKRFYQHSRSNKPIGKAIRRYGSQAFTSKIIDESNTIEDVIELEKKWIAYYDSNHKGYNCTKGGDKSPVIRKNNAYKTKEFSDKMKKNAINQHSTPKTKQTHLEGIRNYWNSLTEQELAIRKQKAIENGKKNTVGWNKGMKFPGRGLSGEKNPMAKQYRVWCPDGSEKIVNCLSDFCKKNKLTYRNACYVVQGKQQHHKGFKFARLENHS